MPSRDRKGAVESLARSAGTVVSVYSRKRAYRHMPIATLALVGMPLSGATWGEGAVAVKIRL
jgi:hypothetical protein